MAPTFTELADDLRAETALIVDMVEAITEAQWQTPTPAPGWTIADQIGHLAFFDDMASLAAADPDEFRKQRSEAIADPAGIVERAARQQRGLSPDDLLRGFVEGRAAMLAAYSQLPEGTRVPWYGPDMSAASKLTARVMETWAHGFDIADALHVAKPPTRALRNVAHICARTMPNSFLAVGREVPDIAVFVALEAPDGSTWTWGDSAAAESVQGDAVEFCLISTQRRHVDDTSVRAHGDVARTWLSIAQAFAGAPGAGRVAGQFTS